MPLVVALDALRNFLSRPFRVLLNASKKLLVDSLNAVRRQLDKSHSAYLFKNLEISLQPAWMDLIEG